MNRIDGHHLSQLQSQAKKSDQTGKNQGAVEPKPVAKESNAPVNSDSVEISAAARQLQELEKSMDTKAFNEQKVSLIKQAIDDGTYKPDSGQIAQKMIDLETHS